MGSAFLRRLILCLLLAAIPVQGIAAAAMLYCCDRAGAGDATLAADAPEHHEHATTGNGVPDEHAHHDAHADHGGTSGGTARDDGAQPAKCSVCAAFCSGGVIVSSAGGLSAPLPCASPRAVAPATPFSSFFPDLAERPPLALL